MFCGAIQEEEKLKEAKPIPQTLNLKNYLRCLRILRDKVYSTEQGERERRERGFQNKSRVSESREDSFCKVNEQ